MAIFSKNNFDSMDDAINMLTAGMVNIDFIKRTGDKSIRHMRCTLNPKFMPEGTENTVFSIIQNAFLDDAVYRPLPVWDFIAAGWRSFYLDSTIEIREDNIFGDTTELVEDIVEDRIDVDDKPDGEITEEVVESVSDMLQLKIGKVLEESPEKIVEFSANKLKVMALELIKRVISGRKI